MRCVFHHRWEMRCEFDRVCHILNGRLCRAGQHRPIDAEQPRLSCVCTPVSGGEEVTRLAYSPAQADWHCAARAEQLVLLLQTCDSHFFTFEPPMCGLREQQGKKPRQAEQLAEASNKGRIRVCCTKQCVDIPHMQPRDPTRPTPKEQVEPVHQHQHSTRRSLFKLTHFSASSLYLWATHGEHCEHWCPGSEQLDPRLTWDLHYAEECAHMQGRMSHATHRKCSVPNVHDFTQ